MRESRIVQSAEEMQHLAAEIASQLNGGEVMALSGELGAGKTTFVQGLAKALGITQPIASPTFALERQYRTAEGQVLHHFDWYRLDSLASVQSLGVEEYFGQITDITVIEWPERAPGLLPSDTIRIGIAYDHNEQTRKVTIDR
jgi:tRNA threonylcarbamoyladenosine biosynthesis protein TsaE